MTRKMTCWKHIIHPHIQLLPNTSVYAPPEAVSATQMARLALEPTGWNWKFHPWSALLVCRILQKHWKLLGTGETGFCRFTLLPRQTPLMQTSGRSRRRNRHAALAAPIGTNKGLQTRDFLQIIIEQSLCPRGSRCRYRCSEPCCRSNGTGCGSLSGQCHCRCRNPVEMATAFKEAVIAGSQAYEAGLGITDRLWLSLLTSI